MGDRVPVQGTRLVTATSEETRSACGHHSSQHVPLSAFDFEIQI